MPLPNYAINPTPEQSLSENRAFAAGAGDDIVSFCNTGHWAAINWFVLSEVAGQSGARMYPGSMVEWSQAPGASAAMDNVPGRAGQLLVDFRLWVDRTFN